MIINPPIVTHSAGNLELRAHIAFQDTVSECFYGVPEKYASFVDTSSANCFLVGLLYPAMRYGEDIHVEGKVSARLLYNLNQYVIHMLSSCDARLHPIHITAKTTDDRGYPDAKAVTTGFSGGIDSFHAIYGHYEVPTPDGFRLTHLLSFNVGAHGIPKTSEEQVTIEQKFHARYKRLASFPKEIGLDFIPVNSNIHCFHPWGHLEVCTLANLSAVLFLQRGIKRYYLASSGHPFSAIWHYLGDNRRPDDIALLNTYLLPWMSTESCDFLEDGSFYDRSQKTAQIADYPPVAKYLNVCCNYDTLDTNCSICNKCCRTLLTLELLGKLEAFSNVFDLNKYHNKARRLYIARTIVTEKTELFSKHLMDLAREKGINLRAEVNCLDIFRAKMMDGRLHNFIRNNRVLKKIAKMFFKE